jgi:hypothetical protein
MLGFQCSHRYLLARPGGVAVFQVLTESPGSQNIMLQAVMGGGGMGWDDQDVKQKTPTITTEITGSFETSTLLGSFVNIPQCRIPQLHSRCITF